MTRRNAAAIDRAEEMSESAARIGERLREMRERRSLSIRQLAKMSETPASTLSKIENGQLNPSLVVAIRLARALDENLGFLVGRYRDPSESLVIVRARQRATIRYDEMGLSLQDLNGRFIPGVLEARIGVLSAGATSGKDSMTHPGEEFCYVIAGALRYTIAQDAITLRAGGYIHFKSTHRHAWENVLSGETRVLWIFSDGLSF